jgi:hypothetical protein
MALLTNIKQGLLGTSIQANLTGELVTKRLRTLTPGRIMSSHIRDRSKVKSLLTYFLAQEQYFTLHVSRGNTFSKNLVKMAFLYSFKLVSSAKALHGGKIILNLYQCITTPIQYDIFQHQQRIDWY